MNSFAKTPSPVPFMQASKWLQLQALLDSGEMRALFEELGEVVIYSVGHRCKEGEVTVTKTLFLQRYDAYAASLKNGIVPDSALYRNYFSSVLTVAEDHMCVLPAGEGMAMARAVRPVVQLQLHTIGYSTLEKKFRPMVFGKDSIQWGVQFSFPQLFYDPDTKQVEKVAEGNLFPNARLFKLIQKWMREHTQPTPFLVEGEKMNVPMRLGKQCFSWIRSHPQLLEKNMTVMVKSEGA